MASGHYEPDPSGRRCFRPYVPQPPRLEAVIDRLDPALDALRRFDWALGGWGDPALAGRLFARLDAVHSSGAEGSTTTFTDLLEYQSSLKTAPDADDAKGVAACADALGEPMQGDLVQMIRRLHARLFEGRRDPMAAAAAGRFKSIVNATSDGDAPGGLFFYTRPESVLAALGEWQAFTLASEPGAPELVRQALSHWMFEHIHPTADGNGRIGRLLTPLVLRAKGVTNSATGFFSEAVHEDKQLYVEALKQARVSGDMTGWVRLILSFLERTAQKNIQRLERLGALREDWRAATASLRADSLARRLAPYALTNPAFTIADALGTVGGTFASVNLAAARLVERGILAIAGEARRGRLFQAPAVLDIFDRFRPGGT